MEEKKEVIQIEGEVNKKKKTNVMQIIFLILLLIAIFGLIFTTITIIKYKAMLQNPLGYNLAKFNLESCTCFDNKGELVQLNALNLTT